MLSGLRLENPIIPASGTFGFGYEFSSWYDINILGSIALKSTTKTERFGNLSPRIAECRNGMLNAIGLQNPGVDAVILQELPKLNKVFSKKIIASVAGFSPEEYVYVAEKFDAVDQVGILEINLSCPNVKENGVTFASCTKTVFSVCQEIKKKTSKPVYIKLSPNVSDIVEMAICAKNGGADGLTLCNTLLGTVIDTKTGRPVVSTKVAGFSGPAIKPVALKNVYQVSKEINIPIIASGGICDADDVIEFLSAGATATEVGSQNLVNPFVCKEIIEELPRKMEEYGIKDLKDIIGRSHYVQ
jgi:dihydroorotate dehydrogenase (NAD+) catalytic subunit